MKIVLSLSGGMDSTTLLSWLLNKGHEVYPFQFTYGSKHGYWEMEAVKRIEQHHMIEIPVISLENAFLQIQSHLLKSGGPIPEGHYNDLNMVQTVVPGRNSIFISILTGVAESIGARRVAVGVHSGDHFIYPDCRPRYIDAMDSAMRLASDGQVSIWAPFLDWDKTKIIKEGIKIGAPYHLTRTCYKDQPVACGKCGSCQERLEAFRNNDFDDPIDYEVR